MGGASTVAVTVDTVPPKRQRRLISQMLLLIIGFLAAALALECGTTLDSLAILYGATGGDTTWVPNNWFAGPDYCAWDGIECDQNDNIIYLTLNEFNLTGQLPPEIGCFPFLKSLLLNDNSMTTTFVEEICELQHLKYLQMDYTGVYGPLPECICSLEYLMYFYADDNAITGVIPTCVDSMTYLREMHLDCNDLEGDVPVEFENLDYLEELRLRCSEALNCGTIVDPDFIYICGDINCEECPPSPITCPDSVEIPGCGTYYPA
eukprot:gnl/Chilomastix_cuspidata/670.p1 GENE.gnl/Chilomastix_cuspidata/670~~gnl/Chilomastix_cuspidata/670.p1  ORF type:complete len:263 (+),score=110.46 gnl/Chilomastix_cuspidata/670:625-1413(+)